MSARIETVNAVPDLLKWLGVTLLLVGGVVGYHYWEDESLLLRVIALLIVVGVAIALAVQTEKGRIGWDFVRESKTEVRKVVWPTRKETTQTTMIVLAMVAAVSLLMWGLDAFLAWAVQFILGSGA